MGFSSQWIRHGGPLPLDDEAISFHIPDPRYHGGPGLGEYREIDHPDMDDSYSDLDEPDSDSASLNDES